MAKIIGDPEMIGAPEITQQVKFSFTVNLAQIDNGIMVTACRQVVTSQGTKPASIPTAMAFESLDDVVAYLQAVWPRDVKPEILHK